MAERELHALDRGAVDFVDKARGTEVLAHRLAGDHREGSAGLAGATPPAPSRPRSSSMATSPCIGRRRAPCRRQQDVGLTMTEYKIVALLVSHKGEVLTYRAIYDTAHYEGFVAGSGEHGHNTNVRSLLKRIRKKFLAVDPGFSEIENRQGVGYCWREPRRATSDIAEVAARAVADEQADRRAAAGEAQVVDAQRLDAVDQGAQARRR